MLNLLWTFWNSLSSLQAEPEISGKEILFAIASLKNVLDRIRFYNDIYDRKTYGELFVAAFLGLKICIKSSIYPVKGVQGPFFGLNGHI